MTHLEHVKKAIKAGANSLQEIYELVNSDIPRPSIRRVLGQGAIKGIFQRLDKGIYTLTSAAGEIRAYIECGSAEEVAPRLEAAGHKFDMVFLDPAYFSKHLIGRNRGIKDYDFIHPEEFAILMKSVYNMMRTDDSHVYVMLSQAPSVQMDMHKYIFAILESGLQPVSEGRYYKIDKAGKPILNVRGKAAASERLMLFSRSGKIREGAAPLELTFTCERPPVKTSYSTQKNESFLSQLIEQSTHMYEVCADFFGGSGMFGKCALNLNRVVYVIEKLQSAVDNFIIPKIQQFNVNA